MATIMHAVTVTGRDPHGPKDVRMRGEEPSMPLRLRVLRLEANYYLKHIQKHTLLGNTFGSSISLVAQAEGVSVRTIQRTLKQAQQMQVLPAGPRTQV